MKLMARLVWKQSLSLRGIEKRARATSDPLERLRYVRSQMDSSDRPPLRWRTGSRQGAMLAVIAVLAAAALLLWRLH